MYETTPILAVQVGWPRGPHECLGTRDNLSGLLYEGGGMRAHDRPGMWIVSVMLYSAMVVLVLFGWEFALPLIPRAVVVLLQVVAVCSLTLNLVLMWRLTRQGGKP